MAHGHLQLQIDQPAVGQVDDEIRVPVARLRVLRRLGFADMRAGQHHRDGRSPPVQLVLSVVSIVIRMAPWNGWPPKILSRTGYRIVSGRSGQIGLLAAPPRPNKTPPMRQTLWLPGANRWDCRN